ncbi:unnamed protein product, partial [Rotaria sordida]
MLSSVFMATSSIQRILELRNASIPKDSLLGYLLPDSSVLNYSATQLVIKLAQGQLAAGQVITAYLKRAGIAHQLT